MKPRRNLGTNAVFSSNAPSSDPRSENVGFLRCGIPPLRLEWGKPGAGPPSPITTSAVLAVFRSIPTVVTDERLALPHVGADTESKLIVSLPVVRPHWHFSRLLLLIMAMFSSKFCDSSHEFRSLFFVLRHRMNPANLSLRSCLCFSNWVRNASLSLKPGHEQTENTASILDIAAFARGIAPKTCVETPCLGLRQHCSSSPRVPQRLPIGSPIQRQVSLYLR